MQPMAYLCFTLLSILIQFSLLDFINTNADNDASIDNESSAYKENTEIFSKIKQTPHALFYRTEKDRLLEKANLILPMKYSNASLNGTQFISSTEIGTTVFDLLYDDNISLIDDHFTSETPFSTTEFDNVTEITFYDKKSSTVKPTDIPKKVTKTTTCNCNLLQGVCDINCCCDDDCTEKGKDMFQNCKKKYMDRCNDYNKYDINTCYSELFCRDNQAGDFFQNLFCIDKINLPPNPTRNNHHKQVYSSNTNNFFMWPTNIENEDNPIFSKEIYVDGQMIWILTNKILNILEIPTTLTNNYCDGKKTIRYLKNENIKCLVKLQDLHLLNILKGLEDTHIVSPTITTINNTVVNCTSVECVKWTLLVCDDNNCVSYNKSIHEPTCSERYCNNIAVKVNYLFYCNESTIIKAVIKLHVTRVPMILQVVEQDIIVNFFMTNDSIDNVVQLSGSPGYIKGLPVIASYSKNNHTKYFFNNTIKSKKHISVPINKNGICLLTNITNSVLNFGQNKRMKCRLTLKQSPKIYNGTDECLKIQNQIKDLLGVREKVFISPYGNPQGDDDKWLGIEISTNVIIYGEYRPKSSTLLCFNLVKSISFVFAFANTGDIEEENKILNARIYGTADNVTFDMEDLSLIITIDTNFIDMNKSPMVDFQAQNLNILLPRNFSRLPSNKSYSFQSYYLICICFMTCFIK